MFSKSNYRPRYRGWRFIRGIVQLVDAIGSILGAFVGYDCNIYMKFAEASLRKDMRRAKQQRELAKLRLASKKAVQSDTHYCTR